MQAAGQREADDRTSAGEAPGAVSRRRFLQSAAAAGLLAGVGPGCAGGSRRPNVLFVFSDSHRSRALGCYGNDQIRTPNFDALAGQGVLLETAVANTPLCRPWRASLMTGTFGHHNGMLTNTHERNFRVDGRGQWHPGDLPTLGRTFAAAGYVCGYIGKWHLGVVNTLPGPLRFGFDDYWAASLYPSHTYWDWTYATNDGGTVTGGGSFRPTMETDLARDFMRERQQAPDDRPWLLMLSWGPPHDPFEPPEAFRHYGDIRLPPNVRSPALKRFAEENLPLYYGLVEAIDHEFGRLMAELDALGLADDTIVIYASDHGTMMGSKGFQGKEMPFQESTGVPFLARWPGRIPGGSRLALPFGAPDIFPTLCGLCGVSTPAGLDGADYSARLQGRDAGPRAEGAYLASHLNKLVPWPGWRGVRTERYLYASKAREPWLLFDLQEDPWEFRNLVDSDAALTAELDGLTGELMEACGDSWTLDRRWEG